MAADLHHPAGIVPSVWGGLFLDIVDTFQLFTCRNQTLLVRQKALLDLGLGFDILLLTCVPGLSLRVRVLSIRVSTRFCLSWSVGSMPLPNHSAALL